MGIAFPRASPLFPLRSPSSIDALAVASMTYHVLDTESLITVVFNTGSGAVADIVVALKGTYKFPERFWNEHLEMGVGRKWFGGEGIMVDMYLKTAWSLELRLKRVRGKGNRRLSAEKILIGGLAPEPTERATTEEIVRMLPEQWGQDGLLAV
jgi:hypothetical protein